MWEIFLKCVFILGFTTYPGKGETRSVICKKDQALCRDECYSPASQQCEPGLPKICSKTETICNGKCVDPKSKKVCIPGIPGGKSGRILGTLCDPGQAACTGECYSSRTHDCLWPKYSDPTLGRGGVVCPKGQSACGTICFHAAKKQCLSRDANSFVCGKTERLCGSLGCYLPKSQTCFESANALCPIGKKPPCRQLAQVKQTAVVAGTKGICKEGETECGSQCFARAPGKVCVENQKMCLTGQKLCGKECYKSTTGDKCLSSSLGDQFICFAGLTLCKDGCYDPKIQVCLPSDDGRKVICRNGDESCGSGCYKPKTQRCVRGEQDKYGLVCSSNEIRCGSACYKAGSKDKVCIDNGTLCKPGDKVCGGDCFNPTSHVCLHAQLADEE